MKGFTFSQLAVILLVVLGLTVAVVIAATQFSQAGSSFAQIGSQVGDQAIEIKLGIKCMQYGGYCGDCTDTGVKEIKEEYDFLEWDCAEPRDCCG